MLFGEREGGVWFCYRWVGDGERDIIVYLGRGGEFFVWGGAEMILRRFLPQIFICINSIIL